MIDTILVGFIVAIAAFLSDETLQTVYSQNPFLRLLWLRTEWLLLIKKQLL